MLRQKIKVSNAIESFLGTRKSHACAVHNFDEANFFILVATHEGQKDDVIFFALEVVNGCQANTFEVLAVLLFDKVSDCKHLSSVGGQYCNLPRTVGLL